MSQRHLLARILFDFSSSANSRTWRSVVAAGAMIGATHLAHADQAKAPPPPPAAGAPVAIRAEPPPVMGAQLVLMSPQIDFLSVTAGKKKTFEVELENTGTEPLKLDKKKVTSSCKCLTATLPKAAVAPGGRAKIKLTLVAPRTPGDAEFSVVIKYVINAADKLEGSAVINATAFVEAKRPRTNPKRFEGRGFILS
jgi:hypothetical protein